MDEHRGWRTGTAVALCAMVLMGGCREEDATQLMVVVYTNLTVGMDLTRVSVQVSDPEQPLSTLLPEASVMSNQEWVVRAPDSEGPGKTMPLSFAIVPQGNDPARRLRLIVTGYGMDSGGQEVPVIQQVVKAGFRANQKLLLEVFLWDSCFEELCLDERATTPDAVCQVASGACGEAPELVMLRLAPDDPIRQEPIPPGLDGTPPEGPDPGVPIGPGDDGPPPTVGDGDAAPAGDGDDTMGPPGGDGDMMGPPGGDGDMMTPPGGDGDMVEPPPETCDPPRLMCGDGGCYEPTDVRHCGGCDNDCTALPRVLGDRVTCSDAGECVVPMDGCGAGYAHCTTDPTAGCETAISTANNCGGCGNLCPPERPLCADTSGGAEVPIFECVTDCADPTPNQCGDECVSLESSAAHCGRCGDACEPVQRGQAVCMEGECGFTCNSGAHECDGRCLSNDSIDSCGDACVPCPVPANGSATCDGTSCGISCGLTRHLCGDSCESNFSPDSCGSACTPCPVPTNGTATCNGVACGMDCPSGRHLCGDSCELDSAVATCGTRCMPCTAPVSPCGASGGDI